ncbi:MAG TPA: hypothetical protein VF881_07140 [Polyangiaceae bacterium]
MTLRGCWLCLAGLLLAASCAEIVGIEDTAEGDTMTSGAGGSTEHTTTSSSGDGGTGGDDGGGSGGAGGGSPDGGCPCSVGQTRTIGCNFCGTQTDTCSDKCEWIPGACMPTGTCNPGQSAVDCGSCTKRVDTCSTTCQLTMGMCISQCLNDQICANNVCCFNTAHYCETPSQCCSNNCLTNLCQ